MFLVKVLISGLLIAVVSSVARRHPGFGALIAALPLISVLGMVWLWLEKPDPSLMANHTEATFWYVLPSLPMFLVMPFLLRHGMDFWLVLAIGCSLTCVLYLLVTWVGSQCGLKL
ncbi:MULTISPECIES: DUF3147 family protein [unclassified Saccharibacter]|uniref:DUF3147 family protein n=1 Tax=unclassified Saccharibacter TaxID=2648722 RepID=UPI00132BF181|nr:MULTISPECIES: DUF3147 family protein [unclassified Saccharibacter]MXV36410.1 hypothetical protein [Saccharibacter sp. EH611]MXV57572.1 hypothetical protein [Saccharibacter sp. EH70]MXV65121.1 hypothetical protein [Saccharibacter sp. EH60]